MIFCFIISKLFSRRTRNTEKVWKSKQTYAHRMKSSTNVYEQFPSTERYWASKWTTAERLWTEFKSTLRLVLSLSLSQSVQEFCHLIFDGLRSFVILCQFSIQTHTTRLHQNSPRPIAGHRHTSCIRRNSNARFGSALRFKCLYVHFMFFYVIYVIFQFLMESI